MGYGVAVLVVLVLFPFSTDTYIDDIDDDVIGFSTENETEPTVPTSPESMPLILNVSHQLL